MVRPLLVVDWLSDLAFLGLALGLLAMMAYRNYLAMEPLTAFITDRVTGGGDTTGSPGEDARA